MRRRDDVIWRPVEGQVVGLDLASSRYFSLNASASVLWEALADDVDRAGLVDVLVRAFAVRPDDAAHDVDAFLDALRQSGLLSE